MRIFIISLLFIGSAFSLSAQKKTTAAVNEVTVVKNNAATLVKNQGNTGTCWCFATTSLIESQCMLGGTAQPDISEMFTVRNIYLVKARNYLLRQGNARFSEGGLGHDVLYAASVYGLMPETAYSGLKPGQKFFDHSQMEPELKLYLDSLLKKLPLRSGWENGFNAIMDKYMGAVPSTFSYEGREYNAQSFAREVVRYNPNDYVSITSFSHHPFYSSFVLEVPDNHSNGSFYNLPLNELVSIAKSTIDKGYTIMWDADVSNKGWLTKSGYALVPADTAADLKNPDPEMKEKEVTQEYRQQLFESLITQDDHLMHITGIGKTPSGKTFFIVKNSWGSKASQFDGYAYVSEAYFALNTINIIVPKAVLSPELRQRLHIH